MNNEEDFFKGTDENDVVPEYKTEEEIAQTLHRNMQKRFDQGFQRRNLAYLPIRWLHKGPRVLKIAQAVVIQRNTEDPGKNGIFVYVEVWKRPSSSLPHFTKHQAFLLDETMTQSLLSYVLQAEIVPIRQEEERIPFPVAEIFDNLSDSQRQTFATLLRDLALTHQLTKLYESGQLSLSTLNHLAAAAQQIKYKAELLELRFMVEGTTQKVMRDGKLKDVDEHAYQEWFERHSWVFGTEHTKRLDLRDIDTQATIDIALQTSDGFIDILELKIPEAKVLLFDKSHKTWHFSLDVVKVLA